MTETIENNEMIQQNKMGSRPVNFLLITMSLPMMLAMLAQAMYNIVDRVFVAYISETALAAVALTFPLQMFMLHIAVGIGIGVNALLSKSLGEKRPDRARLAALNGIFLGACAALIFMAMGVWGVDIYFRSQQASGEILAYGRNYLSWICLFSATLVGQVLLERLLISTGKTFYQMISMTAGAVLNIVLDPILIFGWFGFPAMGVTGAAFATVIAEGTACALALYFNLAKNKEINFSFKDFLPDFAIIKQICVVGTPSVLMGSLMSLVVFVFNIILMNTPLGETGVAIFAIYFGLQSFIFMPVFGLNNALIPIVAFNFGARYKERIIQTIKLACFYASGIMFFGLAVFQLVPDKLLMLFNATDRLIEFGVPALRIISLSYPLAALGIMFSGVFQGLSRGWEGLWISIFRQAIILLPAAWLLSRLSNISAIWWAYPISDAVALLLGIYLLRVVYKKLVKPL